MMSARDCAPANQLPGVRWELTMAWDPTQRPAKPRVRAVIRQVPALGASCGVFATPSSTLSEEDVSRIMGQVRGNRLPVILEYFIIEMGRTYCDLRLSAEPPRSETRYELRSIAYLASRPQASCFASRVEISRVIHRSNRATNRLLFESVRTLTGERDKKAYEYFYYDLIDCSLIAEAAFDAQSRMKGRGDYANEAMAKVIHILAFVYECATGSAPTFSRMNIGANAFGSMRTRVASNFGCFMLSFFQHIDPSVSETQVTSAVERSLAEMRSKARENPLYYQELVSIL